LRFLAAIYNNADFFNRLAMNPEASAIPGAFIGIPNQINGLGVKRFGDIAGG